MATAKPRLKFLTALIADEIRHEANGKQFFIGVYSDNIVVPEEFRPNAGIRAAIFLMFEAPEAGEIRVNVNIIGPGQAAGDGTMIKGTVTVANPTAPKTLGTMTLPNVPILMKQPGVVQILAKHDEEDDWEIVRVVPVVREAEQTPAAASEPPSGGGEEELSSEIAKSRSDKRPAKRGSAAHPKGRKIHLPKPLGKNPN